MFINRSFFVSLILLSGALATAVAANDVERLGDARALYEEGKNDEAQSAFEELLGENKNSADVRYHLGMLALRRSDFEAAIKELEKAVELAPDSSEYHRRLGDAYGMKAQNTGMFSAMKFAKMCKRSYEAAVEADPANIGARLCLMDYYKEAPGFIGGSMKNAYAQADEIEKLDPDAGRWARATVLLKDNKPEEAFTYYDGALTREPASYDELFQLGRLSQWTGLHLEKGLQALDKCLLLTPTPGEDGHEVVQFARGEILERQKDLPAARLAYGAALELRPGMEQAAEALEKLR